MPDAYCDVSLPVPLDQPFTYLLPETLRLRVQTGCRVLRSLTRRKRLEFLAVLRAEPALCGLVKRYAA
jgi:primosomal protein N'